MWTGEWRWRWMDPPVVEESWDTACWTRATSWSMLVPSITASAWSNRGERSEAWGALPLVAYLDWSEGALGSCVGGAATIAGWGVVTGAALAGADRLGVAIGATGAAALTGADTGAALTGALAGAANLLGRGGGLRIVDITVVGLVVLPLWPVRGTRRRIVSSSPSGPLRRVAAGRRGARVPVPGVARHSSWENTRRCSIIRVKFSARARHFSPTTLPQTNRFPWSSRPLPSLGLSLPFCSA